MAIKCLGRISIDPGNKLVFRSVENNAISSTISIPGKLELGGKTYLPLTDNNELNHKANFDDILSLSAKTPQRIGEVGTLEASEKGQDLNKSLINRLWLYDSKLYISDRNDYDKNQMHLLILDYLDRQKSKFDKLNQKYKQDLKDVD